MPRVRLLILALTAVMLLAPAVALASGPSAGDNQYTDPLGNSPTPSSSGSSGSSSSSSSSGSSSAPASTSTPAAGSTSSSPVTTASTTSTTASSTATVTQSSSTLPRTGFDAWMPAAVGLALLGLGFAVRRQVLRQ